MAPARRVVITSRCAKTIFSQRRALAAAAVADGWEVFLIGDVEAEDTFPARLAALGFTFLAAPVQQGSLSPLRLGRLFVQYCRRLRTLKPAVFHAFTIKPIVVGLPAAALMRTPVRIATIAGLGHVFLSSSPAVRWTALALYRFALRRAHRVIFYNEDDRALFRTLNLVRADQDVLIPGSGVDTSHFAPAPARPDDGQFIVLFIGRLLREKGLQELLLAAEALRARAPHIRLQLLGDFDENNPSSVDPALLQRAEMSGAVVRLGAAPDVRPFIAAADAVILPSHREGTPLSLLEAASMGKPLIATNVAGCRDVVRDGETGILTELGDADGLMDAIVKLANDPARARAMGAAAREDICRRFSSDVVSAQVLAEYRGLSA